MNKFNNNCCLTLLFSSLLFSSATQAKDVISRDDYGPLRLSAQSPLPATLLTPQLRSGFASTSGTREAYASATAASVWIENDEYFADYYHNTLATGLEWQLSDRWQMDANFQWTFSADNHLDSVTIAFHDAFGFDQNNRDGVGKHQNQIINDINGIHETDFEGDTMKNAISLYLGYQILQNQHHGLSVGASVYYNYVPSGVFASSNLEQALQLNYSYRQDKHNFHSTVGISFRGDQHALGDSSYTHHNWTAALGYEYFLGEKHGLLVEYRGNQGAIDNLSDLSSTSHEVTLGYRYYLPSSAIEFSMVENLVNMDNSSDIAFSLGYRSMF